MKKRHYILFIAGDVQPQIIGPFGSELTRDKTIRTLREKRGSQHGYFRLEQNPLGSLLAAAYANSWWQEALDAGLYEINDVQDKDIDNAGPDLTLARPVAESLNKSSTISGKMSKWTSMNRDLKNKKNTSFNHCKPPGIGSTTILLFYTAKEKLSR